MSEIVAAVVAEQLKGYPSHLASLRDAVAEFQAAIARFEGIELVFGAGTGPQDCAFNQVVIRLDVGALKRSKAEFKDELYRRGVPVWHANFELIPSLTLFAGDAWQRWLPCADGERTGANYHAAFPVARQAFDATGLGLGKMNFLSPQNLHHLIGQLDALCRSR